MDPISAALSIGDTLIKRLWPDPEQRDKARLQLAEMAQSGELADLAQRAGIVKAEAESEHWLTANWRPLTMMVFVWIIFNNYVLAPYAGVLFGVSGLALPIPPQMWELLKLGLGGYVVSRGGEKMIRYWRSKADTD